MKRKEYMFATMINIIAVLVMLIGIYGHDNNLISLYTYGIILWYVPISMLVVSPKLKFPRILLVLMIILATLLNLANWGIL